MPDPNDNTGGSGNGGTGGTGNTGAAGGNNQDQNGQGGTAGSGGTGGTGATGGQGGTSNDNKGNQPAARVVPEKYEIKLPDGALVDAKVVERITAAAKAKGLTNDEAQGVTELVNEIVKADREAFTAGKVEEFKQQMNAWVEQVKNDKEIGGPAAKANADLAHSFLKRFATPEFMNALTETGFGNHPELVRVFVRAAKAIGEDQFDLPTNSGGGGKEISTAEALFGATSPKTP